MNNLNFNKTVFYRNSNIMLLLDIDNFLKLLKFN